MPLVRDIARTLTGYAIGQMKICVMLAALYAIGYGLLDVPYWPLVGVASGMLNVVPVFGPLAGLLLALSLALIGGAGWERLAGVLGVYAAVQAIEGFWLSPAILGRSVNVSAWIVFAAVFVAGLAFGPVGMLLAVPALAVWLVVCRHLRRPQPNRI